MVNRSKEFETRRREREVDGEGKLHPEFSTLYTSTSAYEVLRGGVAPCREYFVDRGWLLSIRGGCHLRRVLSISLLRGKRLYRLWLLEVLFSVVLWVPGWVNLISDRGLVGTGYLLNAFGCCCRHDDDWRLAVITLNRLQRSLEISHVRFFVNYLMPAFIYLQTPTFAGRFLRRSEAKGLAAHGDLKTSDTHSRYKLPTIVL